VGGAEHAGTGYEVNETKVELGMLVGGVGYSQRTDAAGNRCARGGVAIVVECAPSHTDPFQRKEG
jgi:hypothetical protein